MVSFPKQLVVIEPISCLECKSFSSLCNYFKKEVVEYNYGSRTLVMILYFDRIQCDILLIV